MNEQHPSRARQDFEQAVVHLDQATVNRLRLMRRETLATPRAAPARRLVPMAAFAAGALALVMGWRMNTVEPPFGSTADLLEPGTTAEPANEIAVGEDELYAWLGEAPVASDGEAL
jgi:hypothetical protein